MAYLLDTGILLRLTNAEDKLHTQVKEAVRVLIGRNEEILIASQNVAEFWSVVTRPEVNNGLGKTPVEASRYLRDDIEPICGILAEINPAYNKFKYLLAKYNVSGKQVHDARLVAMMLAWQVESILTLNDRDFRRYEPEGIRIVTPTMLLSPDQ